MSQPKPVLYLDPEMPRTYMIPDNDPDHKLYNQWLELCYDLQFADYEVEGVIEAAKKACQDFQDAHTWKEAPFVQQQTLLLGAGAAFRGYGKFSDKTAYPGVDKGVSDYTQALKPPRHTETMPEKSYVTHPDNILGMSDEEKARFDIRPMKTQAEYMKEWGLADSTHSPSTGRTLPSRP